MKFSCRYVVPILMILSLLLSSNLAKGQMQSATNSKFSVGGNFNFNFGTVTYIEIAPDIIYAYNEKVNFGGGLSYTYYKDKTYRPYLSYSYYGGKLFAQFFPIPKVFIHAEYQRVYYQDTYNQYNSKIWMYDDGLFIGLGYRESMGMGSFSSIAVLWNVLDNQYSFGINPVIRFGFGIGI